MCEVDTNYSNKAHKRNAAENHSQGDYHETPWLGYRLKYKLTSLGPSIILPEIERRTLVPLRQNRFKFRFHWGRSWVAQVPCDNRGRCPQETFGKTLAMCRLLRLRPSLGRLKGNPRVLKVTKP